VFTKSTATEATPPEDRNAASLAPDHDVFSLESAEQALQHTDRCIDELRRALSILPRVDHDGYARFPISEELQATRETCRRELACQLRQLQQYFAGAEAEIQRLERDATVVDEGRMQLHGEEAKDWYCKAEDELEARRLEHVAMRDRLEQKIKAAEQVLTDALAGPCPPGRPWHPPSPLYGPVPVPETSSLTMPHRSTVDQELDRLMEIDWERRPAGPSHQRAFPGPLIL
jgi:hypothetical protein